MSAQESTEKTAEEANLSNATSDAAKVSEAAKKVEGTAAEAAKKVEDTSKQLPTKAPGFEVTFAALGLLAMALVALGRRS